MRRALLLLLVPAIAHADSSLDVTLNAQGQALAQQFGQSEQQMTDKVKAGIDSIYQTAHIDGLLRAFANTAAFSDRSAGVAYLVDHSDILVGVLATGALSSDASLGTGTFVGGAIVNLAVTAGVNLGRWDHPAWTVFANGFYESQTVHGLDGHLTTTGAHVQRKVVAASERWAGVDVTSGLEYARWTVGEAMPIHTHFTVTGTNNQKKVIDYLAAGTLDVRADTYSVPIEVTTGVRLGVLGLYGGGGLDLTFGSSDISAVLTGDLTVNKEMTPIGTAKITATGSSGPDSLGVHAFGGIELHTRHVRVFLQGAIAPGENAVTLGLRVAP
jgi:hypothetical protein